MATYLRRDDWVTDAMGNAQSGASVYVCTQPATTSTIPPSPLAQLYSDPLGADPITQPVVTDGYGHAFYYVLPGTYTIVYYSPQIEQVNLADQTIGTGNVSFPITIAEGGTNATTAEQALINLGAAASGANADITSLSAIPNTAISTAGYEYGSGVYPSGTALIIANQTWFGGYTGIGLGVSNGASGTLITAQSIGTNQIICEGFLNEGTTDAAGQLRVGDGASQTTPGIINSYATGQSLSIGPLGNTTNQTGVLIHSSNTTPTSGQGLLGFDANYFTQTTVGAAGGASALPATPRGYLQFTAPDGTICVIAYYAHA